MDSPQYYVVLNIVDLSGNSNWPCENDSTVNHHHHHPIINLEPVVTDVNVIEHCTDDTEDVDIDESEPCIDHIEDIDVNATELWTDDTEVVENVPDHEGIPDEKISRVGMCFESLLMVRKFYANYAKKVGFVPKVRNTNYDKANKELKILINQSINCNREGYRSSRVRPASRSNRIAAIKCKARIYVMVDKEKGKWIVSKLELRDSHLCSSTKSIQHHEYRELTLHAKCVIEDNDEAGIRPNKTYLALANEVGGSAN